MTRKVWKAAPDDLVNEVRELYNRCLINGEFPRTWKTARLVLIPKACTNGGPLKYRPICLLDDVGKRLERIIAERIKSYLQEERRANLSERQHGFRNGRSTIDAMLNMKEYIQEAMHQEQVTIGVSLDIRNAFNSIPWGTITEIMRRKKFPMHLIKIIDSYLKDRFIRYKNCEGQICERRVMAGVPQGSVLGPVLWNIAFDSVLETRVCPDCRIIAYADDTLLLVRARDNNTALARTNICVAAVVNKIEGLGLQVAASKTGAVLFRKSRKRIEDMEIRVGNDFIPIRETVKYLGVIFDKNLTFRCHFTYIEGKAHKVMRALWRLMSNLRGPGENKRKLYSNVIHSVMLYAAPVWSEQFGAHKTPQMPIKRV